MKLSLTAAHSFAAALAGVVLVLASIATAFGWTDLPPPFASVDVAVVYVLAALPLLASLTTAALLQLPLRPSSFAILCVELATLAIIPRLYIQARCQRDFGEALQLAHDSHYGEASALAHRIVELQPNDRLESNSVAAFAKSMDQIVHRIEQRLNELLPHVETDAQRVQCADGFALLGKTREAITMLDASPTLANDPQACTLRGSVYDNQRHWQLARDWYVRAKAAWHVQPDSDVRSTGLAQATRGIAFCERKLGRLSQAEAAWQDLLDLTPTAETHLLLAQFYEDTQQTAKAQFHAQQATELAPASSPVPR